MSRQMRQLDSVLIEGNRMDLERQFGVATEFENFRDGAIVFARSLLTTFPGSTLNRVEEDAAIPATGAGHISAEDAA